jgi:hypothetical protein
VLNRVLDAFISKTERSKKDDTKVVLPKEEFNKVQVMAAKMKEISEKWSTGLEFKYLIWFIQQQIENRLESDEPRYMFYARIAVKVFTAIKATVHIGLSHGADISAYADLFSAVKDILNSLNDKLGDKDPLWPAIIVNISALLKYSPANPNMEERKELKEKIIASCKKDNWMMKFSVIQTIQQMLSEGSLIEHQDADLSKLCADLLLEIFKQLDNKADEYQAKNQDRPKIDTSNLSDLMEMVTQTYVLMVQQGFPEMVEQARSGLLSIRLLLKNNSAQDKSLFENTLLQCAGTNSIDKIAFSFQPNQRKSEDTEQTIKFFEQARFSGIN